MKLWDYLEAGGKRSIEIAHRRWGKDEVALHRTAVAVFERPATYWHLLPMQTQGRKAIWEAVNPHTGLRRIDEAFPLEIRETTRENEMTIRFINGSMWHVVGSDNYNALVGSPPAGVVYSEWALSDPSSWAFLRPILAENGGWATFITTPRGHNHAKKMLDEARDDPGWFAEVSPATETGVFTAEQLETEKREYIAQFGADHGLALYRQEYLCSFDAAILGAYYSGEIERARNEGRIKAVGYDRYLPVMTAWDLGYTDSTSIWFIQASGTEVHLIDYYQADSKPLSHYAEVLNEKKRAWGEGFRWGEHYFPHDVQAHELTVGRSRVQTLRDLGIDPQVVPVHNINDGINSVRRLFDRFWIDSVKCKTGIDALAQYRRELDEKTKMFRDRPVHDWSSHGADALRCFAAGWYGNPARPSDRKIDRHRKSLYADTTASWRTA